jgi:hypothetical protein
MKGSGTDQIVAAYCRAVVNAAPDLAARYEKALRQSSTPLALAFVAYLDATQKPTERNG